MNKYVFDKKLFGRRIKFARKRKNLTQEQLSDILNINPNTLARVESENNKLTLSYTNLIELANTLDLNIEYLFLSEKFETLQDKNIETLNELILKLTDKEKNIVTALIKALLNNRDI